jgi:hypothetical protein
MSTTLIIERSAHPDAGSLTVHLGDNGAQLLAQNGRNGVLELSPTDVAVLGAALAAYRVVTS